MRIARPGFQCGLDRPLLVREEIIPSHPGSCRLAYISDIHLRRGRSAMLSAQILSALRHAAPDIILLGGDLVDQASELDALGRLAGDLLELAPVFAIPGNHDLAVGEELVRESMTQSGAEWIQGRSVLFHHDGRQLSLSGPGGAPLPGADVAILCAHNPSIWKKAKHGGYHLVLAGHLHGCQGVLFEMGGRLFPGAFFYPYNFIRSHAGGCHLLVSAGCSDLIPIRWGCPREIILCIL